MALAAQYTFIAAVARAEGVRQVAKAAAYATFQAASFAAASLAAYNTAFAAADVAYITAVNTAANTEAETIGNVGQTGPIAGNIANILWQGN
jgi:hypothetical protein